MRPFERVTCVSLSVIDAGRFNLPELTTFGYRATDESIFRSYGSAINHDGAIQGRSKGIPLLCFARVQFINHPDIQGRSSWNRR